MVFRNTVPKLMIGWDISRKYATFNDAEAAELRAIGTERARVAVDSQIVLREFCRTTSGVDGFDQPDPYRARRRHKSRRLSLLRPIMRCRSAAMTDRHGV